MAHVRRRRRRRRSLELETEYNNCCSAILTECVFVRRKKQRRRERGRRREAKGSYLMGSEVSKALN
jgi:hypothetical protein